MVKYFISGDYSIMMGFNSKFEFYPPNTCKIGKSCMESKPYPGPESVHVWIGLI